MDKILLVLVSDWLTIKIVDANELEKYDLDSINNKDPNMDGLTEKQRDDIVEIFQKYESEETNYPSKIHGSFRIVYLGFLP